MPLNGQMPPNGQMPSNIRIPQHGQAIFQNKPQINQSVPPGGVNPLFALVANQFHANNNFADLSLQKFDSFNQKSKQPLKDSNQNSLIDIDPYG